MSCRGRGRAVSAIGSRLSACAMMKRRLLVLFVLLPLLAGRVECFVPSSRSGGLIRSHGPLQFRLQYQTNASSPRERRTVHGMASGDQATAMNDGAPRGGLSFSKASKTFCRLSPLWTVLSAAMAIRQSSSLARTVGSLPVMQTALSVLMLAMGLTITPRDVSRAVQKPRTILLNVILCFGMMPALAAFIAVLLSLGPEHQAGVILLGCVSGGQASNLFALLAGGDVALSVACTLSTTVLGAAFIPLLVKMILSTVVEVDCAGMLMSVAQLVLLPLVLGLSLGMAKPSFVKRLEHVCPFIGVIATLTLVAGGASNSASVAAGFSVKECWSVVLASYLLPIWGGLVAWAASYVPIGSRKMGKSEQKMLEQDRRTLVIETLSKSPTLAFVLARKHFAGATAAVPASGMVSLAVVGALCATMWAAIAPIEKYE